MYEDMLSQLFMTFTKQPYSRTLILTDSERIEEKSYL